jgi:four helix bundle protein
MNPEEFKKRTVKFALKAVRFVQSLPRSGTGHVAGRQLLRLATSVGANYRSACCAKSHADFIAKLAIVHEECDESLYWITLLAESGEVRENDVEELRNDAREILAMVVASVRTARSRKPTTTGS